MKSILQNDTEHCFLCGRGGQMETHHIFHGNPLRKISEKNGFKVRLCHNCHRTGENAVHKSREADLKLKQHCQKVYEKMGHSREEFRNLIGKSYIDDK